MLQRDKENSSIVLHNPIGHLDFLANGSAKGWAWFPAAPRIRPTIMMMVEDKVVGQAKCEEFRADLRKADVGDGYYGFTLDYPPTLHGKASFFVVGTESHLAGSPVDLTPRVDLLPTPVKLAGVANCLQKRFGKYTPASSGATTGVRLDAKPKFSRVVVTGDFLRTDASRQPARGSNQTGNILWLHDLLSWPITTATGAQVNFIAWGGPYTNVNAAEFYALRNREATVEAWLATYNRSDPNSEEIDFFIRLFEGSFVVGFELSPFQKHILSVIGVPYVSLSIHPVRFGPDLLFQAETNYRPALDIFDEYRVPSDLLFGWASLCRARSRRESTYEVTPNSLLFCGQIEVDSSLIIGRKLYSIFDFRDEFAMLSARFESILFKRHPHAVNDEAVIDFVTTYKNVRLIDGNSYGLMAHPHIEAVSAISSSMVTEARYFDKPALRLLPANGAASLTPLDQRILDTDFWAKIFAINTYESQVSRLQNITTPVQQSLVTNWNSKTSPPGTGQEMLCYPGVRMHFGSGKAKPFGHGSWVVESWGMWLEGNQGSLALRIMRPIRGPVEFTASIKVMASANNPVKLNFYWNGRHIKAFDYTSSEHNLLTIKIPSDANADRRNVEVKFVCEGIASGAVQGTNSDTRPLALGLTWIEVAPTSKGLPIVLGESLTFGQNGRGCGALVSGWGNPEGDGVWTISHQAVLRFHLANPPGSDVALNFDLQPHVTPLTPSVQAIFKVENQVVERLFLEGGGVESVSIMVPRGLIKNNDLNLTIVILNAVSEADAGVSNDQRQLGIFVSRCQISGVAERLGFRDGELVSSIEDGVCIVGPFRTFIGLGAMTRNVAAALELSLGNERVSLMNFNDSQHAENNDAVYNLPVSRKVNIFCIDHTRINKFCIENGYRFLHKKYNICYGAWELEEMPDYLADDSLIDEYWAISSFVAEAARKKMSVPVYAMPLPINAPAPKSFFTKAHFGIPEDVFVFMFIFCADSTISRKNPQAVLKAFQAAFPKEVNSVRLIFKTKIRQSSKENTLAYEVFKSMCHQDSRVIIIESEMTDDEVRSLYLCTDVYVSLHRSEGYGLTMAEAMAYGRPVIATGYSGNLDFMNSQNSCLVNHTLLKMDGSEYHGQIQRWADPDIEHAAYFMKKLFDDEVFRKTISRRGCYDIRSQHTIEAFSQILMHRLGAINLL